MASIRTCLRQALLALIVGALADPSSGSTDAPLVTLNYGAFQGFASAEVTESFLGIPFAQPPVGNLRFNNPMPPQAFSGIRNATSFGAMCPQQVTAGYNELFPNVPGMNVTLQYLAELVPEPTISDASEDCLYLNVVRPAGVREGADVPVIVWAYGGGFQDGDGSGYNGIDIVSRSLSLNSPVVYVSFNYRLSAFGFLGGKEIQAAGLGNFGLHDQRAALEWVQKYIHVFGGNPRKVIFWGQSAGAISVMSQMVAYDGQLGQLFQGAVMESGSVIPIHDIAYPAAQANYEFMLEQTNCSAAKGTLDCLRQAPSELIQNAMRKTPSGYSYSATNLTWMPLVDGIFLKQPMRKLLSEGKYAKIPAIFGGVDDEGTAFSLFSLNVTTDDQFIEYVNTIFFVGISQQELAKVGKAYPQDPALGSPYDSEMDNALTPQYKRISSFQDVWSYLWKRNKDVPVIGSFHGSDLHGFYNITGKMDWVGTDVLVNFAYTLNPNIPAGGYPSGAAPSKLADVFWPRYSSRTPKLLTFEDPGVLSITDDTFRVQAMQLLNEIMDLMEV